MKQITPLFVFALLTISPVPAQTLSGTLSNFDVFNDTGQQSHGFEIQLEGLSSNDVSFKFGGPGYLRYDVPVLVDYPGGVLVRYASRKDAAGHFTDSTPVPPAPPTATAGHSCWIGGSPGYPTSGCEHFGVGLTRNPTSVQYHWLIEDSANAGNLVPFGSNVPMAAPLWSVTPGVAGGAAVVNAVIAPPKPERLALGPAVWVKVFENESPENAELNHLLTDDPLVPQDASHMEVEWELSQSDPKKPDNGALQHSKSLGQNSKSVIRRFEFYKYTGPYGPEGEALCGSSGGGGGKGGSGGGSGCVPQPGVNLGAYIGAQMAAAQFGPVAAPKVAITSVVDNATNQAGTASGSWVTIYGSNLSGAPGTTRQWQASDFQGTNLPLALDGVKVAINGKPAAIWYISPTQLNVQAPEDAATGTVQVQVTNSSGSATGTATLQRYAPGFFTFSGKYAAAVHIDGVVAAPVGFFGGAGASRPAQPGETLVIYGSGFGPCAPAVVAGQVFSGAAWLADMSQLHIRIGGVPASVQFAGLVAAGEYQFNVVVPALADGDQPLTADMGGVAAQSGVLIPIKN